MKIAVIPGSFDPPTFGHLDIIRRTANIFDVVYVGILENNNKSPLFSTDERKELISRVTKDIPNVRVESFSGLLVNFLEKIGSNIIVKGLRAVSDFEYEFQMALINKKLNPKIETFFMTTSTQYMYLSSSIVKEVATLGGELKDLVPDSIIDDIMKKIKSNK